MHPHCLFFMHPHCAAKWESCSTKNADNHGDNQITEPGSKELTEHPHLVNSNDAPPLVTIMTRCHDPPIAQKLVLWKNPIFIQICGVHESPNSNAPGRKARPFLPLPTPVSHYLHHHWMWETGSVLWCKKQCEVFVFHQFYHKIITKHSPFLCHISQCSYKHATIN